MTAHSQPMALLLLVAVLGLGVVIPIASAQSPAPPKGKSGAAYEKDPGKYTEEPTKNMGKAGAPTSGDSLDEAGLRKILAKLPPGTRHEFLMLPMRDGVRLKTDILYPPTDDGPWPAVLLRTQYSRWDERGANFMEGAPFVMVLQNVRGAWGSEGAGTYDLHSFESDRNDGYDTVEWIASQKWSSGKVGMWGPSGHGIAAINAMWALPPHLTAIDVNVTCDNPNLYFVFDNGARRFLYSWLAQRGLKTSRDEWPRPTVYPYNPKPYFDFLKAQAPKIKTHYRINAGWFDVFSEAALDHFAILAPHGRIYAQMGPSGHGALGGDLKFQARNSFPIEAMKASPKFKDLLIQQKPPESRSMLAYFLMGDALDPAAPGNVWMTSDRWPVEHKSTSYYLRQNGSLTLDSPTEADANLSYTYDPRDPVPTLGGNYDVSDPKRLQIGPLDQRPQAGRKDILRFKTEPLSEPLGVTGKIFAELHIGSDCPDTMFTARLVDIYPNGYEALIRESAMLARYHLALDKPMPLERNKIYRLNMDMWSTALVFGKGHRIALYVSSSSEPGYEVHPNTYEAVASISEARVARNTVHLSAGRASRLILPVVPAESYLQVKGMLPGRSGPR